MNPRPVSYPRLLLTVAVVVARELACALIDLCDAIDPEPGGDPSPDRCPPRIPDALLIDHT